MPASSVEGAGQADALDLKQVFVLVSQQPSEPPPPHALVQSLSVEHFVAVQSGGGAGGFVALPPPEGAGSLAGAACVGCSVGSGPGSDEAHAAISVPVRRAAA